jgi:hypothetical protein
MQKRVKTRGASVKYRHRRNIIFYTTKTTVSSQNSLTNCMQLSDHVKLQCANHQTALDDSQ